MPGDDVDTSFIPAPTWGGSKSGYYFGTGPKGTGYYLDHNGSRKKTSTIQIDETKNQVKIFQRDHPDMTLLEKAEKESSGRTVLELSQRGIKSAAGALVKAAEKNAMERAQFATEPHKYMNSELSLHENIRALTAVAVDVELYNSINQDERLLPTLLQLLGHENADIASTVVGLFLEWLDPTLVDDSDENKMRFQALGSRLLQDGWKDIVLNLDRFQQTDETGSAEPLLAGIDNSLSLMENLLDLDSLLPYGLLQEEKRMSVASYMIHETRVVSWLFKVIAGLPDKIELASRSLELLAIISQREDVFSKLSDWSKLPHWEGTFVSEEPTRKKARLETLDAVEILLQTVGNYRKQQPASHLEVDILENACMTLSCCITFSVSNLEAFLARQGVELVVRCLKERVHSGGICLKLLNFSGQHETHKRACERFVTSGGLKYLFPIFLGNRIPKPAGINSNASKSKRAWLDMLETSTLRVMYALCCHVDASSPEECKNRFVAKFAEDTMKCDRLVELLLLYDEKSRRAEFKFFRSDVEEEVDGEDTIELAALDAKLKGGGDIFFRLGVVTAYVCVHSKLCHQRILHQLNLQQSGISLVKRALEEFQTLLDNGNRKTQVDSFLRML